MIGPGCCAVDHQRRAVDGLCKGCLRTYNKMKKGEKETESEHKTKRKEAETERREQEQKRLTDQKVHMAKFALRRWLKRGEQRYGRCRFGGGRPPGRIT